MYEIKFCIKKKKNKKWAYKTVITAEPWKVTEKYNRKIYDYKQISLELK